MSDNDRLRITELENEMRSLRTQVEELHEHRAGNGNPNPAEIGEGVYLLRIGSDATGKIVAIVTVKRPPDGGAVNRSIEYWDVVEESAGDPYQQFSTTILHRTPDYGATGDLFWQKVSGWVFGSSRYADPPNPSQIQSAVGNDGMGNPKVPAITTGTRFARWVHTAVITGEYEH